MGAVKKERDRRGRKMAIWLLLLGLIVAGAAWALQRPVTDGGEGAPDETVRLEAEESPQVVDDSGAGPLDRPPGTAPADPRRAASAPYHDMDSDGDAPAPSVASDMESSRVNSPPTEVDEEGEGAAAENDDEEQRQVSQNVENARVRRVPDADEDGLDEQGLAEEDGLDEQGLAEEELVEEGLAEEGLAEEGLAEEGLAEEEMAEEEWAEEDLDEEELAEEEMAEEELDEEEWANDEAPGGGDDGESGEASEFGEDDEGADFDEDGEYIEDREIEEFAEEPTADPEAEGAEDSQSAPEAVGDYREFMSQGPMANGANLGMQSALATAYMADALVALSAPAILPVSQATEQRNDLVRAVERRPVSDLAEERRQGDDDELLDGELEPGWTAWQDAADWLRLIQEEEYGDDEELAELVAEVEVAAEEIDPSRSRVEQSRELTRFFELFEQALEAMVDDVGAS